MKLIKSKVFVKAAKKYLKKNPGLAFVKSDDPEDINDRIFLITIGTHEEVY